MVCEQFSPVLPHRYREAALPVGVFRWHLHNTAARPVKVGLMFSFANMNGWFDDFGRGKPLRRNGGNFNAPFTHGPAQGIIFDSQRVAAAPPDNRGQWAIAAAASERIAVQRTVTFDALGSGAALWQAFAQTGAVPNSAQTWLAAPGFSFDQEHTLGGAISATVTLAPGERLIVPMTLVWDLPVVQFGLGRRHYRRYTRDLGRDGRNTAHLAALALENAARWARAIDAWHTGHAARHNLPAFVDRMMFNELYQVVDGWTVWTDGPVEPGDSAPPFFGMIECPDYPYYNTFDLWVYASFALLANWPQLERQVISAYADQVRRGDGLLRRVGRDNSLFPAVEPGAVPHDLGAPDEDPGVLVNAYTYQNPNLWKDLPAQFVVTVCRDVLSLDDDDLLHHCWPAVELALDRLARFDRDHDGMIENDGIPDQTFDNIPMTGPSAYCGGLWLAALAAGAALAERIGQTERSAQWRAMLARGQAAFDAALWNGSYYRLDSGSPYAEAVFIEQLFGPWYAKLLGFNGLVPADKARSALHAVCRHNFYGCANGQYGAFNIVGQRDSLLKSAAAYGDAANQSHEVLVGMNFSLANQLRAYGLHHEAEQVLAAVHRAVYEERGLWFRTPAAYDPEAPTFRAVMNLRPLVIWALAFEPLGKPGEE